MAALKNPKLIIVSAPSGAGKTTLCQKLISDFSESVSLSISTTTREPRPQEKEGVSYNFVSEEDFRRKIAQGEFAEWAEVHGSYYGTEKQTIDRNLANGKCILLDIDIQGARSLREAYGDRCLTFFVTTPSAADLEKRLRERAADSEDTIQKRLKNSIQELQYKGEFEHVILNDTFDRAYSELKAIFVRKVLKERG